MKTKLTLVLLASIGFGHLYAQDIPEEPATPVVEEPIFIEEEVEEEVQLGGMQWREYEDYAVESEYTPKLTPLADVSKLHSGRLLEEVNDASNVDAYPHLSSDGLRLYFTQNTDGKDGIVVASRPNLNSPFGKPTALNLHEDGEMSCWLSVDELTIYFTTNNLKLYKATRGHRDGIFGDITEIKLSVVIDEEGGYGFISGPSLSKDQKQLFLYRNESGQEILHLVADGENSFKLKGVLPIEGGVNPGQVSIDGLTYVCPVDGSNSLVVLTRKSLDDDFVVNDRIDVGNEFCQLSFNAQSLVLCYSPDNMWSSNDLYIADNPFAVSEAAEEQTASAVESAAAILSVEMLLFPNPADEWVNVRFQVSSENVDAQLEIIDNTGRTLRKQQVQGVGEQTLGFDVSDLTPGTYFCRLSGSKIDAPVKILIIK